MYKRQRVDVALEMSKEMSGRLLIKVSDTGVGTRDEDKERIFERFYQVEQEEQERQSTGSGIGLSLVRDFVTLHEPDSALSAIHYGRCRNRNTSANWAVRHCPHEQPAHSPLPT